MKFLCVFISLSTAWLMTLTAVVPILQAAPLRDNAGAMSLPSEPATSVGHDKMLALLQRIADRTSDENPFLGDKTARKLRKRLNSLPSNTSNPIKWKLHMQVGEKELRLGNEAEAINHFKEALAITRLSRAEVPPHAVIESHFYLGLAYMRMAETRNCCLRHTPESCILPIRGKGIHTEQESSRQAISQFTEVLKRTTKNTRPVFSLGTRWLLNIAYMTIGTYPDDVPSQYLIPPPAFDSKEKIPRFNNIAPRLGLDVFDLSGGAIADDFDNDGYIDIVVSTWDAKGQMRYFRNNRDGTFSDRTRESGLLGLYGGLNLVQADYDNDGYVDILVLRGAWLGRNGRHPNSLLRNNGDGTFTDRTFEAGLGEVHYPTQTASWGDYDNDGDLDLYIGNESSKAFIAPCQLFENNGAGMFTDVAERAGVQNHRLAKSVIWGDFNDDGFPDLYVSNLEKSNRLYRNNGDGTFTDEAKRLEVHTPRRSFPSWFWDFDNDGALDIYVSAYSSGIEHAAADALGLAVNTGIARLYRGDGGSGFSEVSEQYNLVSPTAPMGSNFGDLDNDGYLDFYLGTGWPNYWELMPNILYRNRDGEGFTDVTYAGGFGHLQKGHAIAFADFDNDGDQDVFEQMGGAYPGDAYNNALYENPGFGNNWISVQLIGVQSNRSAIGARIHLKVLENGSARSVYKHVNSGGTFGCNPLRQTIGLGKSNEIERLEVYWPTTGLTQSFENVPGNQFIQIVEGARDYTLLKLRRLTLGKSY
ncbi:MAG: CRTAC1 family protein [Candidatus Poribacteria bacterium]|nr:CRTAC1 family protein [Candidatus Poribacteria bacterium]